MKKLNLILIALLTIITGSHALAADRYCGHLIFNNEGDVWYRGHYLVTENFIAFIDRSIQGEVNSENIQKQTALITGLNKAMKNQRENVGTCVTGTLLERVPSGGITSETKYLTKITEVRNYQDSFGPID